MLIKPHDAMFILWRAPPGEPRRLSIISRAGYLAAGKDIPDVGTLGAVFARWKTIPKKDIFACIDQLALEIAEEWQVPVKALRDELDKIEGYTEYQNRMLCMAFGRAGL